MDTLEKSAIAELQTEGVCLFQQFINPAHMQSLASSINKIRQIVLDKVSGMDRPIKTYSDIAERQLGRLDYRCGFSDKIFQQVAAPIVNVIKLASPQIDFRHYWGVITSLKKSGPTDLHRDVYPLLNGTSGQNLCAFDVKLPPYYFTALIPLVEITRQNGPTEFVKGSHQKTNVAENEIEIYSPLLSPGDMVIFDGRTLHRGSANQSTDERMIAYITFVANWYHDQTFVENNYLFPELT